METVNYNLYITDDQNEKFIDWRRKIGGVNNSNMIKIDEALSEKADKSTAISATLAVAGWIGDKAPYTQEVTVVGLTAKQNGVINMSSSANAEQRKSAYSAQLFVAGQANGKITVGADGRLPKTDIPITILLIN